MRDRSKARSAANSAARSTASGLRRWSLAMSWAPRSQRPMAGRCPRAPSMSVTKRVAVRTSARRASAGRAQRTAPVATRGSRWSWASRVRTSVSAASVGPPSRVSSTARPTTASPSTCGPPAMVLVPDRRPRSGAAKRSVSRPRQSPAAARSQVPGRRGSPRARRRGPLAVPVRTRQVPAAPPVWPVGAARRAEARAGRSWAGSRRSPASRLCWEMAETRRW